MNTEQIPQTTTPKVPLVATTDLTSEVLDDIECLLYCVGADRDPSGRRRVLEAIKAIAPENRGFEVARKWSHRSALPPQDHELHQEWAACQAHEHPYAAALFLKELANREPLQLQAPLEELWSSIETTLRPDPPQTHTPPLQEEGLARFSLRQKIADLEESMVDQRPCLGDLALFGQASVIYAKPNTGKTLIVLHLICEAVHSKRLDPSKLFYINMDDNGTGLVEKGRLAEEYGFHMLADGYREFQASAFREAIIEMTHNGTAHGTVIVLDTLKKFVNTMDKAKSSQFTRDVRRFVMRGGTVVALSHTNKKPGSDGKAIYAGTSDIVDDFDCAYLVSTLSEQDGEKVVEFENIKRRGDVATKAAYRYANVSGISYTELLSSVRRVEQDESSALRRELERHGDAHVMSAIKACLQSGVNQKMALIKAAAEKANVSRRIASHVLDRYTGTDPTLHAWSYRVEDRGAKVFTVLPESTVEPDTGAY